MKLDIDAIMKKASDIHNAEPMDVRTKLCISSANTHITTLRQMKMKIKANCKKQCFELDDWIKNIANDLDKLIKKDENSKVMRCKND